MPRVRDLMTRNVVVLDADAPLERAAWQLVTHLVRGAPVRDRTGTMVGVLSNSDLADPERSRGASVADAMTPTVWSISPDDDAMDAIRLMVDKGIHRVIVVDGRRLVGVFSQSDVMRYLAKVGLPTAPPQ